MTTDNALDAIVKPLEWAESRCSDKWERYTAETFFGTYEALEWSDGGYGGSVPGYKESNVEFTSASLEDAKAIAQADYAARILSALDPVFLARMGKLEAENTTPQRLLEEHDNFIEAKMASEKIETLLDEYFALGVAEGREGRRHDTPDGDAQRVRSALSSTIAAQDASPSLAPSGSSIVMCVFDGFKPLYPPDGIKFVLAPGSEIEGLYIRATEPRDFLKFQGKKPSDPRKEALEEAAQAALDYLVALYNNGDIEGHISGDIMSGLSDAIRALSSEPVEKGERG